MGNEFGCDVCSNSHPRYEIKTENQTMGQVPITQDTEVIVNKLRKIQRFSTFSEVQSYYPEKLEDLQNQYGLYLGDRDQDGNRSGKGIQYYENDRKKYFGLWDKNKAHGSGVVILNDDSIYVGEWYENQPQGFGLFMHPDNTQIIGDWRAGKANGTVLLHNNHYGYHGEMVASLRHGKGECRWHDGQWYKGTWLDDNMDGYGIYFSPIHNRYEGEFKQNMRHGYGIQIYNDGSKYEGYFAGDQYHGYGVFSDGKGQKKIAIWQMGQLDGLVFIEENNQRQAYKYNQGSLFKQYEQPNENAMQDQLQTNTGDKQQSIRYLESEQFKEEEIYLVRKIGEHRQYLIKQQAYVLPS